MITLPPIVVEKIKGLTVVRDDLLPGGTKRRAIPALFEPHMNEYVYASPVYGYAQLALAYAARDYGVRATIFCAGRKKRFHLTDATEAAGAKIVEIAPAGYMSVVKARAMAYCEHTGARLLPFGLDDPRFIAALADIARSITEPPEVWTVAGSGVLTRALQLAWPNAEFFAVRVGASGPIGKAHEFFALENYDQEAKYPPPFPSSLNYDAKAWQFMELYARHGSLFWNVGA